MRSRALAVVLELALPVAVLVAWGVWSASADSFYFPPLTEIFTSFKETWLFAQVGSDVVPSLERMFAGFGIAVVAGVLLGLLLGLSPFALRAATPIVEFFRVVPSPALIPVAIVVLGIGDAMKVFIIALSCLFPVLLNTIDGVRGVDPLYTDTTRVYGIRRRDALRHVVLPAALPQVFAGARTSLSLALILMVVSEMMAATNGIGYFVIHSQRSFALPEMWSGVILLGLLGYAFNLLFVWFERRVLHWHRGAFAPSS